MKTDTSLTFLQLKTDLRHSRGWLITFWLALLAHAVFAEMTINNEAAAVSNVTLVLFEALLAMIIVARTVMSDSLVSTTAFWLARPMRRTNLFWSKTVFMAVALALPWLAARTVHFVLSGFTLAETVSGVLFWLFVIVLLLGVFASVASLTRTFLQFKIVLACVLVAACAFAGLLGSITSRNIPPAHPPVPAQEAVFRAEEMASDQAARQGTVFVFALMAVLSGAAWVGHARFGRPAVCVVCLTALVLGPLPLTRLGVSLFKTQRATDAWMPSGTNLQVEVVLATNQPPRSPGGQLLWSHFQVTGLHSNEIVTPACLSASFEPEQKSKDKPGLAVEYLIQHNMNDWCSWDFFQSIKSRYPAGTLWSGDWYVYRSLHLPIRTETKSKQIPWNSGASGTFKGSMLLDVTETVREADLPLRAGASARGEAAAYRMREARLENDGLHIELTLRAPASLFGRRSIGPIWNSGLVPVLFHLETGEAQVLRPDGNMRMSWSLPGETAGSMLFVFPVNLLRQRLAGVSTEDWMRQARLHLYLPRQRASQLVAFENTRYVFLENRFSSERSGDVNPVMMTNLPANPTPAQIAAHVQTLCLVLPERQIEAAASQLAKALKPLGHEAMPALLGPLPVSSMFWEHAIPGEIQRRATPEDKPLLIEALRHDMRLLPVFNAKGWQADARSVTLEKLDDHRMLFPPEAVVLAAEARDSATYADLKWRFVHATDGFARMAEALRQCPDFPLAQAVNEAWTQARFEASNNSEIALLATEDGLPGAINAAIERLERQIDTNERRRITDRLAQLTGYEGKPEMRDEWLLKNASRFRFDAAARRYTLPSLERH